MRCLALGQAWQETGGQVALVSNPWISVLEDEMKDGGIELYQVESEAGSSDDAHRTLEIAKKKRAQWIVLDGPCFSPAYQDDIRSNCPVLYIHDGAFCEHYCADFVLNQNYQAAESLYTGRCGHTQLLLGTKYVLLRKEFWIRRQRRIRPFVQRLLVTLGGADPNNAMPLLLESLSELADPELEVIVLVGALNANADEVYSRAGEKRLRFTLLSHCTGMAEVMSESDIAIVAGGGTLWELFSVGTPTISFVRNSLQDGLITALSTSGIVIHQGLLGTSDPSKLLSTVRELSASVDRRERMSRSGQGLIDGQGARRVARILRSRRP